MLGADARYRPVRAVVPRTGSKPGKRVALRTETKGGAIVGVARQERIELPIELASVISARSGTRRLRGWRQRGRRGVAAENADKAGSDEEGS